jgi:hypothetical protein
LTSCDIFHPILSHFLGQTREKLPTDHDTGSTTTTPPPSGDAKAAAPSPVLDDEEADLEVLAPSAADDVFGSATPTSPAVEASDSVPAVPVVAPTLPLTNPVAQRIANNLPTDLSYNGFTPRADRVSQMPNAHNAQGLYPPDALIFVAKYVYKPPFPSLQVRKLYTN